MLSVRLTWLLLCLLWLSAERKLARSRRMDRVNVVEWEQRSQRVLWLTLIASLALALMFKTLAIMPIAIDYLPRQCIALMIFCAGLALRYCAVKALGDLFTTDVTIHNQHELIMSGVYRWVRHPAYTGLITALTGAGLAMGDILALLMLTLPPLAALNYRINIEEKLLGETFGKAYFEYCQHTKKLLPWLF